MSLGEKLLYLRKKASLSQEDVAEKLSVSRQTVSKW
ncbi:helix-turn-helix transcriptional regulator [Clostridium sp.]